MAHASYIYLTHFLRIVISGVHIHSIFSKSFIQCELFLITCGILMDLLIFMLHLEIVSHFRSNQRTV